MSHNGLTAFYLYYSLAIFIGFVATIQGNYYQYPTNYYPNYNNAQAQSQGQSSNNYYRNGGAPRANTNDQLKQAQVPLARVNRRSQSQQTPSWLNALENPPTSLVQKPRRTHYGQTGTTLTKFFDSVGDSSSGQGTKWSGGGRWVSKSSGAGIRSGSRDNLNRVQMGVSNTMCDDAKTNLTVDWDMSPVNHTCYHPETRFPRDRTLPPIQHCDRLPPRYIPGHICMDQKIPYVDDIPTHGDHRPLWPMFGEYIFVPRERWLHNIEHGAIVMLYHPCAHPAEVNRLKKIVKNCVGKHIITPSTFLPPERPLALVAWGCRLLMSGVNEQAAIQFIHSKSMRGPEGTYTKEGQYTFGLLQLGTMTGNGKKYGYSRSECVDTR